MSRFSARDALAIIVFIVFALGGTAAGYLRWVRSRGPTGIMRDSIDNSRPAAPPTKPAP
jgi:hypothetical protein